MEQGKINEIIATAERLQGKYDNEGLRLLLESETSRLAKDLPMTLGSPRDFVKGVLAQLGEQIYNQQVFTKALAQQAIVAAVMNVLLTYPGINQMDESKANFIIGVGAALVMNAVFEQWKQSRSKP